MRIDQKPTTTEIIVVCTQVSGLYFPGISKVDLDTWDWTNEYFIVCFLYLYDAYEAECYADTISIPMKIYDMYCHFPEYRNFVIDSNDGYWYYLHRKPDFQGFMNYLRRVK